MKRTLLHTAASAPMRARSSTICMQLQRTQAAMLCFDGHGRVGFGLITQRPSQLLLRRGATCQRYAGFAITEVNGSRASIVERAAVRGAKASMRLPSGLCRTAHRAQLSCAHRSTPAREKIRCSASTGGKTQTDHEDGTGAGNATIYRTVHCAQYASATGNFLLSFVISLNASAVLTAHPMASQPRYERRKRSQTIRLGLDQALHRQVEQGEGALQPTLPRRW
jgi:hypothetical protein